MVKIASTATVGALGKKKIFRYEDNSAVETEIVATLPTENLM